MKPYQKIFDRIREAVLPEFRERVADYLVEYETVLLDSHADAAKGSASARPKPARPTVKGHAPPLNEPTSNEPNIGPVQEKDTMVSVKAIKKIPPKVPRLLLVSVFVARLLGSVISK